MLHCNDSGPVHPVPLPGMKIGIEFWPKVAFEGKYVLALTADQLSAKLVHSNPVFGGPPMGLGTTNYPPVSACSSHSASSDANLSAPGAR